MSTRGLPSQFTDVLGLAKQVARGLRPRHAAWALLVYTSIIIIIYGAAWLHFARTPRSILTTGGQVFNGRVVSLRSSGFGPFKHYYIKLESMAQPMMIPGPVINSRTPSESTPVVDLDSEIGEGTMVQLTTSGGGLKAVVLSLKASDGGSTRQIITYENSVARFSDALDHAPFHGYVYLTLGLLMTPVFGFALPWVLRRGPIQAQLQKVKKSIG